MLSADGIMFKRCLIAVGRTDMRMGIDGLSAAIRLRYGLDPLEKGTLFLFCGTRKDRIKGLLWEGDRFILLYIRLVDGRFQWPATDDEARKLFPDEFNRLMEGFSIDPSIGPQKQPTGETNPRKLRKR